MTDGGSTSRQTERVDAAAAAVHDAYRGFEREFRAVTARARTWFERRAWRNIQDDAQERLDLYSHSVGAVLDDVRGRLAAAGRDAEVWAAVKTAYSARIADEVNVELAQTFFNSVTRRTFTTVGVNPRIEYTSSDPSPARGLRAGSRIYRTYAGAPTAELVRRILVDCGFDVGWRDPSGDAARAARRLDDYVARAFGVGVDAIETLEPLFYRNKGAYVVGRARAGQRVIPFVLPLVHTARGVAVDAVLTHQNEVSIVFSFARSYFLVDTGCPRELIVFLKSIMPLKPLAELYIALGFNKHGKTELYRSLMSHLRDHDDRFVVAPGDTGMVMLVFTLTGFDVVFKVIRDRFAPPKTTTRGGVMERYRLVFKHDRVGRMIDAQEFEYLQFARERFSERLLRELLSEAGRTVGLEGGEVVLRHLYAERRVTPLNLYLRRADPAAARLAVIDYGTAIKELAAANIFPGDFLLKNFGVTRHGRVVFYDYDELCLLDDVRFRRMPPSRTPEEELAPEPWFDVADDDVFPEEFRRFLGLSGELRETFERHHADLFTVEFWRSYQDQHRRGELPDVFPYPQSRRLHPPGS